MSKSIFAIAATLAVGAALVLGAIAPVSAQNAMMDEKEAALVAGLSAPGVTVRREGGYIIIHIPSQLTFATNEAELSPEILPVLNDAAVILQQYDQTLINVVGNTDSTGSEEFNLDLSIRRAQSVADYLLAQGISPQRLTTQGVGSSDPVASNDTEEGRAQNRRVELQIFPI